MPSLDGTRELELELEHEKSCHTSYGGLVDWWWTGGMGNAKWDGDWDQDWHLGTRDSQNPALIIHRPRIRAYLSEREWLCQELIL